MSVETKEKQKKRKRPSKTVKSEQPTTAQISENTVFIGKRPVMNYVLACLTYFNSGSNKLVLKARGRAIPRAVDTVELLKRSFAKNLQVDSIMICTEEVNREQGQKSRVSAIEMTLMKQ